MELELFTVSVKEDKTIIVAFNPELLDVAAQEDLLNELSDKMDGVIPIVENIIGFIESRLYN